MENNFKNNNGGGYNKFNNNFQPLPRAEQPVAKVEAPNAVNNLPKPAKAGLVVVAVVGTIWAIDKFALKGRIKKSVLGVFGFGKKKDSNNKETEKEGAEFEETK